MITSVHSVMIGNSVPSTYSNTGALTTGALALFDQNRTLITTTAQAVAAESICIGVTKDKINVNGTMTPNFEFSNPIQKGGKPSVVVSSYTAPKEESIAINYANATIVAGYRYVLRVLYKDIYEAPGQFTHTYEAYATTNVAADLMAQFVQKINKHMNRRINVTNASNVLTLTAIEKTDNEGINSINEYSTVSMEASLYETIPGALLANFPKSVNGITITKTVGNPGKGYWKQVRDAEVRNMGYKGHVMTGAYPIVEQDRKVEKLNYDQIVIEGNNLYLSNDNQYIKTTPLTIEVYCPSMANSVFSKAIQSFIKGSVVA